MKIKNILLLKDPSLDAEAFDSGLRDMFSANVYRVSSLDQARALLNYCQIDLAILDVDLLDGMALQLLPLLCRAPQGAYCVMFAESDDSNMVFECLKRGAKGYLLKGEPRVNTLEQLQGLQEGIPPFTASIFRRLVSFFHDRPVMNQNHSLTSREQQVLTMLAHGLSRSDVAEKLFLSPHTVADHIKKIYRKLKISSRAEATLAAINLGLLSLPTYLQPLTLQE